MLLWSGLDRWLAEAALVELSHDGLDATGTQLGAEPEPYRADYRLRVADGWITRELDVSVTAGEGSRRLALEHDGRGRWTANGQEVAAVHGALDCDLAHSPLTNVMPIRRHELHELPDERDFLMAWVSLPDLVVIASRQRYEHVRPGTVRYVSLDGAFRSELELDADGLVRIYPQLARRVERR
jgi:hypothetical protein